MYLKQCNEQSSQREKTKQMNGNPVTCRQFLNDQHFGGTQHSSNVWATQSLNFEFSVQHLAANLRLSPSIFLTCFLLATWGRRQFTLSEIYFFVHTWIAKFDGVVPQRTRLSGSWSRGRPPRTIQTIQAAAVNNMSQIAHITEVTQILTRQSRQTHTINCKLRSP